MQLIVLSTAILAGLPAALAHAAISQPQPISFIADRDNYNAPLDPSFSNFPCKGYHNQPFSSAETWKAGEQASFTIDTGRIAAHGGGSCQASISHDGGKTFQVLHSFIGDCPRGANDNQVTGPQRFDFMIPEDEPAGEAIFAWTWFNAIGNREMYMNCAYVTIENDKPASQPAPRPNMFVGNLNKGSCGIEERTNLEFPDPGKFVTDGSQNPTAQFKGKGLPSGSNCGNAESGGGEPIGQSLPPNNNLVGGPIAGPKPGPVNPVPTRELMPTTTSIMPTSIMPTSMMTTMITSTVSSVPAPSPDAPKVVYVTEIVTNPIVDIVTVTATTYIPAPTDTSNMAKRHQRIARDGSCSFQETLQVGNKCPVPSTKSSQWEPCVWQEFCPCLDDKLSPIDIVNFSQIKGHCDCVTKNIGCAPTGLRTRHIRRHMHITSLDIILRRNEEDPVMHTFRA